MKIASIVTLVFCLITANAGAKVKGDVEHKELVRENLAQLLDSIKGLSPEEVNDAVNSIHGDGDAIAVTTPALTAVIAASAAAASSPNMQMEASKEVPDTQFDVQVESL